MKITIVKSILENILLSAQPFLEKKDTSQITSHIYIKVENIRKKFRTHLDQLLSQGEKKEN